MRRRNVVLAGMLALVLVMTSGLAAARGGPTLQSHRTRLGAILVNGSGYTLYTYSADRPRHDACARFPGCLGLWPALVSARPSAGPGVRRGLIGTIAVRGVGRQVTYAGHPLYTYRLDNRPAQTSHV